MDLASLHDGPEPESREAALGTYAALLLPGRDLGPTLRLLTPMVSDPAVAHRVDAAAPPPEANPQGMPGNEVSGGASWRPAPPRRQPTPIEQVVGVILGSPEFQRR